MRASSISSGIVIRCSSAMWMLRSWASSRGDGGADAADALGRFVELLGQRERFFAIELGQQLAVDGGVAVAIAAVAVARVATVAVVAVVAAVHGAWAATPCITVADV